MNHHKTRTFYPPMSGFRTEHHCSCGEIVPAGDWAAHAGAKPEAADMSRSDGLGTAPHDASMFGIRITDEGVIVTTATRWVRSWRDGAMTPQPYSYAADWVLRLQPIR